jgi:hypothetical protein
MAAAEGKYAEKTTCMALLVGPEDVLKRLISLPFSWAETERLTRIVPYGPVFGFTP